MSFCLSLALSETTLNQAVHILQSTLSLVTVSTLLSRTDCRKKTPPELPECTIKNYNQSQRKICTLFQTVQSPNQLFTRCRMTVEASSGLHPLPMCVLVVWAFTSISSSPGAVSESLNSPLSLTPSGLTSSLL